MSLITNLSGCVEAIATLSSRVKRDFLDGGKAINTILSSSLFNDAAMFVTDQLSSVSSGSFDDTPLSKYYDSIDTMQSLQLVYNYVTMFVTKNTEMKIAMFYLGAQTLKKHLERRIFVAGEILNSIRSIQFVLNEVARGIVNDDLIRQIKQALEQVKKAVNNLSIMENQVNSSIKANKSNPNVPIIWPSRRWEAATYHVDNAIGILGGDNELSSMIKEGKNTEEIANYYYDKAEDEAISILDKHALRVEIVINSLHNLARLLPLPVTATAAVGIPSPSSTITSGRSLLSNRIKNKEGHPATFSWTSNEGNKTWQLNLEGLTILNTLIKALYPNIKDFNTNWEELKNLNNTFLDLMATPLTELRDIKSDMQEKLEAIDGYNESGLSTSFLNGEIPNSTLEHTELYGKKVEWATKLTVVKLLMDKALPISTSGEQAYYLAQNLVAMTAIVEYIDQDSPEDWNPNQYDSIFGDLIRALPDIILGLTISSRAQTALAKLGDIQRLLHKGIQQDTSLVSKINRLNPYPDSALGIAIQELEALKGSLNESGPAQLSTALMTADAAIIGYSMVTNTAEGSIGSGISSATEKTKSVYDDIFGCLKKDEKNNTLNMAQLAVVESQNPKTIEETKKEHGTLLSQHIGPRNLNAFNMSERKFLSSSESEPTFSKLPSPNSLAIYG